MPALLAQNPVRSRLDPHAGAAQHHHPLLLESIRDRVFNPRRVVSVEREIICSGNRFGQTKNRLQNFKESLQDQGSLCKDPRGAEAKAQQAKADHKFSERVRYHLNNF